MSISVAIALSGGVDSSVAAYLLRKQGAKLLGVTMIVADHQLHNGMIEAARGIAQRLDIPYEVLDLRNRMRSDIISPFIQTYLQGTTPNPCVECNHRMKWGELRTWAKESGYTHFATGHYACINSDCKRYWIERGKAPGKEQSYYLARLSQEELAATLFPLAEYSKDAVKRIAVEQQLPVLSGESQEICFIPNDSYKEFLELNVPEQLPPPGPICDLEGRVLGTHNGIHNFTIGQRSGLGIAAAHRLYVVKLDAVSNTVYVGPKTATLCNRMEVDQLSWMAIDSFTDCIDVNTQIRYRHKAAPSLIVWNTDTKSIIVQFLTPEPSVTPGQTAVFYDATNIRILGCGRIVRSLD